MKKIILILIYIVTYMQVTGQESYQSFFGTNTTKYHIFISIRCYTEDTDSVNMHLLGCGETSEYVISKDDTIMINDMVYYQEKEWLGFYIREDTIKGQLFRYIKEDSVEYLICDMSLNVGDTFTLPDWEHLMGLGYYYQESGVNIIVDSIAYINGKKVIYFQGIEESYYYNPDYHFLSYYTLTFVEGIGPTYGPFCRVGYGDPRLGVLLCVEKDDTLTHITSPLLGCNQWNVSVKDIETNPLRLYPNPVTDKLHIELDDEQFIHGIVQIIDPAGQIVYNTTLMSTQEMIPVSHLSSGIYVLQYVHNKRTFQTKFIKIK